MRIRCRPEEARYIVRKGSVAIDGISLTVSDVPAADAPAVFARVASALPGATEPIRRLLEERLVAKGGVSLAPIGALIAQQSFAVEII